MISQSARDLLNTNSPSGFYVQLGKLLDDQMGCLKAVYDFSQSGGLIGDIVLKDVDGQPAKLPAGAIITQVWVDVVTAPTSLGLATVALKAQTAADLLAATAIASLTVGIKDGVPVGTAATSIKLTAERTITATIAVDDLTAGKFNVFVQYLLA